MLEKGITFKDCSMGIGTMTVSIKLLMMLASDCQKANTTIQTKNPSIIDRRSLSFAIIIFTQPPPGRPPGRPPIHPWRNSWTWSYSYETFNIHCGAKYKTFLLNRQNWIPSPLGARGVKSAIGLIFKMVNFKARVMKLSRYVIGLNIRLSCQIGKI